MICRRCIDGRVIVAVRRYVMARPSRDLRQDMAQFALACDCDAGLRYVGTHGAADAFIARCRSSVRCLEWRESPTPRQLEAMRAEVAFARQGG